MPSLSILILAAGKGTRMRSSLPKVLHKVGPTSMIERVVRSTQALKPASTAVIVGHQADRVKSSLSLTRASLKFFKQSVLNGSGGAVKQALSWIKKQKGVVLVTCGDTPLLTSTTFKNLLSVHKRDGNSATVLSAHVETPAGYGRIKRALDGRVLKIVEELDARPEEKRIHEINIGTYCFDAKALAHALPKLKAANAKKEFYLTDVLEILNARGTRVGAAVCEDSSEGWGVNSKADLAKIWAALNRRTLGSLMDRGVTIIDPASTYIDESVKILPDTVIWPQSFITGDSKIGSGCEIGPWAYIKDTQIENKVTFKCSFSDSSIIKVGAQVGPYSRVRPNSILGPNVHLGNFSEVKNAKIGQGSKVSHLSYLGDATLGKNVNIGAGTITCNYDGIRKSPTFIQDQAFIGSNVNLIAPITVGAHAVVGAGSSLSEDVPAWALAVERAKTRVKKDWAKKKFKKGRK